jgi:cytochrome P450
MATSTLTSIPGSGSPLELFALLGGATRFLRERFERHGRIFRTRLVYPVVFLVGDEANKTILVTRRHELSFGLGYAQTAVKRVFEGSIMLQDGEAHDRTRDVLSPAVGVLAVRESAERVRKVWEREAESLEGASVDAYTLTERATFAVAANVLTGLALGEETEAFRPYFERLIDGIMAPTSIRVPFGRLDRALRARARLVKMLRPRVLAARARPPEGLVGQLAHHRDASGSYLDVDEIVGHLLLLFWAGYDTTASSASWVLHELARRPDWQDELRRELASHPEAASGNLDLPHVNAFLQEVERMYPSALFFPRIAMTDFAFGGYVVPKGTPTFYTPYMSHRDPESFERPDSFEPERWLAARGEKRAVVAKLVGFGGGPRVCLGKTFAKLQLRVMLGVVLSRYRLERDGASAPRTLEIPIHHPIGSKLRFTSSRGH